jgi:hypothetical protein
MGNSFTWDEHEEVGRRNSFEKPRMRLGKNPAKLGTLLLVSGLSIAGYKSYEYFDKYFQKSTRVTGLTKSLGVSASGMTVFGKITSSKESAVAQNNNHASDRDVKTSSVVSTLVAFPSSIGSEKFNISLASTKANPLDKTEDRIITGVMDLSKMVLVENATDFNATALKGEKGCAAKDNWTNVITSMGNNSSTTGMELCLGGLSYNQAAASNPECANIALANVYRARKNEGIDSSLTLAQQANLGFKGMVIDGAILSAKSIEGVDIAPEQVDINFIGDLNFASDVDNKKAVLSAFDMKSGSMQIKSDCDGATFSGYNIG